MPCKCQDCGNDYFVDLMLPNELWEKIKPEGKEEGAGLLCGACIMKRLDAIGHHEVVYYSVVRNDDPVVDDDITLDYRRPSFPKKVDE